MNALPTMQNLRLRGVVVQEFCPLCNNSSESTSHALIHCEFAAKVWSNQFECPIKLLDSIFDISDIALELLNFGTVQDLEVLFSTAQFIWYNRNQVIHEANFSTTLQIWESAQRLVQDFINVNSISLHHSFLSQPIWTPPPCGLFIVNVDGATSQDHRPLSIGAIIRNSKGLVIAVMSKTLPAQFLVEEVEAIALENGVLLALEMNLTDVIVESDSLLVVQYVQKKEIYGALSHIIQGMLSALSVFRSWRIQLLKRESNRAAHELAQLARASEVSQIWKGMDPPCIQFLLRQEHL